MKIKTIILITTCLLAEKIYAAAEEKVFDSAGLREVSVDNSSGRISISAVEGPKATVTLTKNKFSEKCKLTEDRSGSKLILKVETSQSFFSNEDCNVDFEIKIPKSADINVVAGSGNLMISGIEGSLTYKLGSGDLSADGAFKKLVGHSGSGQVKIKGLTNGGEIKTGSGSVELKFASVQNQGEIDIKTGSGDATVLLPKGSKIKTSYHAGSGQLSNDFGEDPAAGFLVSMKAGSGNLKVKSY